MVTAKTQCSLTNAQDYFTEHLCVGDYYEEGQRVAGHWFGLGAERLGLAGKVQAEDFLRLCGNQHPSSGETLTQRLKGTRTKQGQVAANRRIFYDFTFSPPKSVSLAAFLGNDERILAAHTRAVRSALTEFEAFAATRLRVGGAQRDRSTGNFTAALFTHDTSRALDPHLHTHCIVFNATFDATEDRWKALQNHELLRARKFAENAYHHELARELRGFGYRIRNRTRGDFQIEGVSDDLCDRFSKRHAQIDAALEKLLADNPELKRADVMALRRHLATAERSRKQKDLKQDELQRLWDAQTTPEERAALHRVTTGPVPLGPDPQRPSLTEAVQWAEEHLFDRQSVVMECQVWQEALGRARGEDFSLGELKDQTRRGPTSHQVHRTAAGRCTSNVGLDSAAAVSSPRRSVTLAFGMRSLEMPRQRRMLRAMTTGFTTIRLEDYVERHLRSNPDTDRAELIDRLRYAIAAYRRGEHCRCGQPIWIIGSAEVGLSCFTCITGESEPDQDYEIDLSELGDTPAEPPSPANGSQPSRPDTNRTSSAAGSRR